MIRKISIVLGVLAAIMISVSLSAPKSKNQLQSERIIRTPVFKETDLVTKYGLMKQIENRREDVPVETLNLNKNNTLIFREDYNPVSVAKLQKEMLSKVSGGAKHIFLALDTPGGDIRAGNSLNSLAQGLGIKVDTITIFAASMGFGTAQSLGTRYIQPHGVMMAHRARVGGVDGQIPGEFLTAAGMLLDLVYGMERSNAARLGLTFEDYTALVKDEYWVTGADAVKQGAADKVANIRCASDLLGTSEQIINLGFFTVKVIYSDCPAIEGPLDVIFVGANADQATEKDKARVYSDITDKRLRFLRTLK